MGLVTRQNVCVSNGITTFINGLSGTVGLLAGSNITLTPSGNNITIASAGGGGGGSPGGSNTQVQINQSGSFGTDPFFTDNAATHNVLTRQLNNIPYVSQYQTGGGGNGLINFFGTNPLLNTNQIAIDDNGNSADGTINPTPVGSIIVDLRSTSRAIAPITATAVSNNVVTVTAANDYFDNDVVILNGLTTNTYLNGQYVTLTGANSTSFTFNFTHANYTIAADTGTAINQFGTFGTRFINCTSATGNNYENNLPFIMAISAGCQTNFAYENWAVSPNQSHATAATIILDSATEYPGYDIGNPNFFVNSDTLWSTSLGVGINSISHTAGIRNTLTLSYNCFAAGDCNPFALTGIADGGYTAASDQGVTVLGLNTSQTGNYVQTSIAGTSGFGDTNPTFNSLNGAHFTPGSPGGGFLLDTQTAVASGTMLTGGGLYQTGGALNMFVLGNGSGMIPNPVFTVTAIATSSGGSTTLTGTFPICGSNACAQGSVAINGFTNPVNNAPSAQGFEGWLITASSTTSLTISKPNAVAETHAATATMSYAVICTGGGGSGMTGWTVTVNFTGNTNTNPGGQTGDLIGSPGADYTSVPSCVTSSLANSGSSTLSTFTAQLTSTLHTLPIAGTSLTPSTGTAILATYMSRSAVDMVNQSYNINVTIESGAMSASTNGGRIWIASDPTPEMCQVTAAGSVIGITQALTVSCHLPHPSGSLIFQGGTSGFICLDAQAAGTAQFPSWPFCTYAYGAADSTHIIYGWLVQGTQINGTIPEVGNMRASFVSGANGWHIYKGAQVVSTTGQGTVPTLNVNDVTWAVNDAVMQPMPPSYASTSILAGDISQAVLTPSGGAQAAFFRGGESMSAGFTSVIMRNQNSYGAYIGCDITSSGVCLPVITAGGPLAGPGGIEISGPYRNMISTDVPLQGGAVIVVPDSPTTPDYALFADNSGAVGTITIQPSARETFFSQNLGAGGTFFAGASVSSGGSISANTTVTAHQGWIVGNPSVGTAQMFQNNQNGSQHVFFPIGYVTASSSPPSADTTAWLSMGELYSGTVYAGSPPPFSIGTFIETPGSTSYEWEGKCVTQNGESLPATTSITTGPAAITVPNFVNIKVFVSPGCQSINVYRVSTSGGLSAGFLGNVTNGGNQTITDSGQAPSSGLTPDVDNSGLGYASIMRVGVVESGVSTNTDLVGELSFAGVTTASYTFLHTYTNHPVCVPSPEATTASSGEPYVTYTGSTSMTVNFPSAFTGNVGYVCAARN